MQNVSAKGIEVSPRLEEFLRGTKKLYINGEWVNSLSGKTFETVNPATGEKLADVAEAGPKDIDLAVKAAREAFDHGPWSKMGTAEKSRLIYRLADLMEENKQELAQLETLDNGKPIRETMNADVPLAIEHFRYFAGWATKIVGKLSPYKVTILTIRVMKHWELSDKLFLGTSHY